MPEERYAPRFSLSVYGTTIIPEAYPTIELIYEESVDVASMLRITIPDPEFRFIDSTAFGEGNPVDISIGYNNDMTYMGRVEWQKQDFDFPDGNTTPTLQVIGYDYCHRLMDQHRYKARAFRSMPDSEIVKKLANTHKDLTANVTSTIGKRTRVQKSDVNDFKFLKEMAERHGFYLWCEYSQDKGTWVLYFRDINETHPPKDTQTTKYKFKYAQGEESTLLSFRPEFSTRGQKTHITVVSFDRFSKRRIKQEFRDEKKAPTVKYDGQGAVQAAETEIEEGTRVRFTAFGKAQEVWTNKPVTTEKQAKELVKTYFKLRKQDFLTTSGAMPGLEKLRPRQTHSFDLPSKRFTGDYFITKVIHRLGRNVQGGYRTEFSGFKV